MAAASKKIACIFFCHLFFIVMLLSWADPALAAGDPPISAQAAILLNPRNGQVLWEKNPDQRMHPASTTKIMTAMLALQKGQPDDVVTVSHLAAETEGSVAGLHPGEQMTLQDLLYALLLPSANDAALAIAEHIGGTVEEFVVLMNAKARQLGADGTHFANPHGLTHPQHYSTARDLALIALQAAENPVFREIVATPRYQIRRSANTQGQDESILLDLETTNQLLWENTPSALAGTTGIKTGFTTPAGRCLVFSVRRGERELLGVLLNSPGVEIYQDARILTEYGLHHFQPLKLAQAKTELARAAVTKGKEKEVAAVAADDFSYDLPVGQNAAPVLQIQWREDIAAPLAAGEFLGQARWSVNSQEIGRVDLVAAEAVPKKSLLRTLAMVFWGIAAILTVIILRRAIRP